MSAEMLNFKVLKANNKNLRLRVYTLKLICDKMKNIYSRLLCFPIRGRAR